MDFSQWFNTLPKVTKIYMIAVFATTFLITYPIINIVSYLILDYDFAIYKLHIWRFVTNFFIVGKFSFNFLFFMLMM